jgi:hypothetical protein
MIALNYYIRLLANPMERYASKSNSTKLPLAWVTHVQFIESNSRKVDKTKQLKVKRAVKKKI